MKRSHVRLGFHHELDDHFRGIKQRQPNVLRCIEEGEGRECVCDEKCNCLSNALCPVRFVGDGNSFQHVPARSAFGEQVFDFESAVRSR